MKHLDLTFDLETCSLSVNAAVLQIAAVAWDRHAQNQSQVFLKNVPEFVANVDLRSCFRDGFDFDSSTQKWWMAQQKEVQEKVFEGDCYPLKEVAENFIAWIKDAMMITGAESVCLWAEGSDYDNAILRTILRTYNLELPFSYRCLRDARTFVIEICSHFILPDAQEGIADNNKVYSVLPKMPDDEHLTHSAIYDAIRTSWALWQAFSLLPDPE